LLFPPSLTVALSRLHRKSKHLLLLLHHHHRHREYRRSFHAASSSADLHRSTTTATRSRGFIAEMNSAPLMLRLAREVGVSEHQRRGPVDPNVLLLERESKGFIS
ncbi:uncharacterized protein LOC114290081, partial [Camellia sinensis]|uniref:uncharacterized protein LOC114290081 n=1 Tax=Camellia sinensis TaxID=4442 RepID=UPI001036B1B5